MFWIGKNEYPQVVTIWQIEDKGTYAQVRLSTSSRNKDGSYSNSNWSFVRFVGKAYNPELLALLPNKENPIKLEVRGGFKNEPYEKDGETKYPKNPSLVIFEWELSQYNNNGSHKTGMDSPPVVEEAVGGDEEKLPWETA